MPFAPLRINPLPVWSHLVRRGLALLFLLVLALGARAQQLQPIPDLTAHVIDLSGTLSPAEQQALEARLSAFEASKGSQIVVLMLATTQPEDIAAYAHRVASSWKIGRRDVGDGVLVVVAKNDRRMRIEVARALEGAIPDLVAARIIDQQMAPAFRQNDFAGGIGAAIDQLTARISGEALPEPQAAPRAGSAGEDFDWMTLGIFLFFGVMVIGPVLRSMLGRPLGALATGGAAGGVAFMLTASMVLGVLAGLVALAVTLMSGFGPAVRVPSSRRGGGPPIILPGPGHWGGGGGHWGGGGGFGSGGGGSFGGGGASGGW